VDEADGCGTPERRSDGHAACKSIEEAEIYNVPHETSETSAKTPQLKRPSESYTTGFPMKRTNKEKLHELNDKLNYAVKPILDKPNEPMEIAYNVSTFSMRSDRLAGVGVRERTKHQFIEINK